ncbi:dynamin family protein [Treponema denticola]|uniref:dynamin family protein n=1 Tax=Treponema denticola TaxID=158 RepID=UPI0020A351CC|nr:dynamin family protein [Treponema denticola]UTD07903.1 dynamin family protein [Treponema denticola]
MKEDVERNFKLFRMYDKNHIICDAPFDYRNIYYTALRVLTHDVLLLGYENYFDNLKDLFLLYSDEVVLEKDFLFLNKVYRKRKLGFWGFFKKPLYSYKYVYNLIIEAGYILHIYMNFDLDKWLNYVASLFKLSTKKIEWFKNFFCLLFSEDYAALTDFINKSHIPYMKETIKNLVHNLSQAKHYESLSPFNIAVIATMSSGKSTFVNALLGNEIFPEANTACTAKITSVYDNDSFKRIAGLVMKNGNILQTSNNLNNDDLIKWNMDKNIDRIILEGNLDNISNKNKIVTVHDTPGTNFSGDNTHHDITFDFLTKNKMDTVIFIANAEHLATTDVFQLLTELYEKIVKKQKNKVVFVINKSDSIDSDKERIADYCKKLRDEIVSIGFNPKSIIIPISAKSARLFKMAIKGESLNFTQKEKNDFMTDISLLLEDNSIVVVSDIKASCNDIDDSSIYIENKSFSHNQLRKALYNTGLPNVEKALEMIAANLI